MNWLVRHQASDGSWSFNFTSTPGCDCSNAGGSNSRNAATALALLPLMGAGNTHASGPYKDNVCRGLQYLLAAQDPTTGSLSDSQLNHNIYSHLMATLALAEAVQADNAITQAGGSCPGSGTTTGGSGPCLDTAQLRQRAQLALDYTIGIQSTGSVVGGWRYGGGAAADVSHHIWGVTSLFAGRTAGLNVPQAAINNAQLALNAFQKAPLVTDQGVTLGNYQYNPNQQAAESPPANSNAEGLLCAVLLGAPTSHSRVQSFATNPFNVFPPGFSWGPGRVYYNFHTTHLLYRVGGSSWNTWNTTLQQQLQAT